MVEQWSNNRLLSATVDQIPLGAMIYLPLVLGRRSRRATVEEKPIAAVVDELQ